MEHNRQFHIHERPFICELCGESFSRNQQFQVHTQAHEKKNKNFKYFKNSKNKKKIRLRLYFGIDFRFFSIELSPPEKEEVKDDNKKSRKRKYSLLYKVLILFDA